MPDLIAGCDIYNYVCVRGVGVRGDLYRVSVLFCCIYQFKTVNNIRIFELINVTF